MGNDTAYDPRPLEIRGKRALVVGMGSSGAAAAAFLRGRGADVTVTDSSLAPLAAAEISDLTARGIRFELGGHTSESFILADLIVVSPGVPHTLPLIREAADRGAEVLGELELASRFMTCPIIAVTGTNGKTTTTALLGHLLAKGGYRVVVGGNIGTPLSALMETAQSAHAVVAEVSSFQLDTIGTFRPRISVLLNITPDHLDRYADMSAYAESKGRVFKNQGAGDLAVLNGDDPEIRRVSARCAAGKSYLYARGSEAGGTFLENFFKLRGGAHDGLRLDLSRLRQPGQHNRENAAAAALAALAFGVGPGDVQEGLATFRGLPHRLSPVAEKGGVRFFNDSKATNIDAVAKALAAFDHPVVVIMGGRGKGYRFQSLAPAIKARARGLVALGETAPEILHDLGSVVPSRACRDMDHAVQQAFEMAAPGDVVLLSPGCASFDMFKNYSERGEAFCRAVAAI